MKYKKVQTNCAFFDEVVLFSIHKYFFYPHTMYEWRMLCKMLIL